MCVCGLYITVRLNLVLNNDEMHRICSKSRKRMGFHVNSPLGFPKPLLQGYFWGVLNTKFAMRPACLPGYSNRLRFCFIVTDILGLAVDL